MTEICVDRAVGLVSRVLDPEPVTGLVAYTEIGGGRALDATRRLGAAATIAAIGEAGVRGRGGAGFPTGRKWSTISDNQSERGPATVVMNAAEGEPGSFKDRELLLRNPYRPLEGALCAASAVGATRVIVATKGSFVDVVIRVRAAIDEFRSAGWLETVDIDVFAGPDEYLFGEETALLECIDGRPPFPRITPPYRRGLDDPDSADPTNSAADTQLAGASDEAVAPPTLVDNVETFSHCTLILQHGADWFRELGTDASPGTVVCTVTGDVRRPGVGEVAMGTPLATVIDLVGGGVRDDRSVKLVLQGVSSTVISGTALDVPVSWDGFEARESGLGSGSFIVFDEQCDVAAVVADASRFLAVESCGQCVPCKRDGLAIADALARLSQEGGSEGGSVEVLVAVRNVLPTLTDGARCSLALQHQSLVTSVLDLCEDELVNAAPREDPRVLVAPMIGATGSDTTVDDRHRTKQPDWTYETPWSGKSPVERLADHTEGLEGD